MPLITVCGSQGQGKTTVLSSLAEAGYNVIPHKTSRSILDDWNLTLNEVNKDLELKKKYQDEVLVRHQINNMVAAQSEDLYFSERSYADIFTYTLLSVGAFNEYCDWLNEYYDKCKESQAIYHSAIRLGGRSNDVSDDGVRSINHHFTNMVDIMLTYYLHDFGCQLLDVNTPSHSERMDIILDYVEQNFI
jgi:predicted ATPase